MIGDITRLLEAHGPLTLRELANRLRMAPEALEPLMQLLVRKHKVRLQYVGCGTRSCGGCSCASREDALVFELASFENNAEHAP